MRSPNVFGIFSVQISIFFNGNIRFRTIFVGSIGGYMVFLLNASQLAIVCGLGGLSALNSHPQFKYTPLNFWTPSPGDENFMDKFFRAWLARS